MTQHPSNLIIEGWLRALERPSKKLSEWELQFLESVADDFHHRETLTTKQASTLEAIYTRATD